jgi:hypothetical protein
MVGQVEVAHQVLAYGSQRLPVGLTCTLIACVRQPGRIGLGNVGPLKQELLPLTRTVVVDKNFLDRWVQRLVQGLAQEPTAMACSDSRSGQERVIEPFNHFAFS